MVLSEFRCRITQKLILVFQVDQRGSLFRKRSTLLSARGTGQQPSRNITSCHLGETPGLSGQGKHADFFYFTLYWNSVSYRVLVGKPEGKRPLGRLRRRWVDNIRIDLQEVGCGYMDWIGLAQDRDRWRTLVSAVMNLGVAWNAGNFLTSCKPVSFSRRTLHHGVSK